MPTEYFEQRERALLGQRYEQLYAALQQTAERGVTVSALRTTPEQFAQRADFPLEPSPFCKAAFVVHQPDFKPGRHPYHHAGVFYSQEPSASSAAPLLGVQPGMRVLDLCAAPGGKSSQLAAALQGRGVLVSNEYVAARAEILKSNLERMGVSNAVVLNETPARIAEALPEFFDRVLVDAPCSGEGMFHKEPKMAEYWLEKSPDYYAEIQKELIVQGAQMLKPGGKMLYSTCTFSKKENEETIAYLLEQCEDMEVLAPLGYGGFSEGFPLEGKSEEMCSQLKKCVRIFPHKMAGEGHFLALLQKKGNGEKSVPRKTVAAKKDEKPDACVEEFLKLVSFDFSEGKLKKEKDKVYFLPGDGNMPKLRYLRTGLYLGEIRKNRFEPSQALAMALSPKTFASCVLLSSKDIRTVKYLKGETIDVADLKPAKEKGWQLVCVDGFSLGFGKLDRGILKNKYYPGWRMQ